MTELRFPESAELADRRQRLGGAAAGAVVCGIAGGILLWSGSALGWVAIAIAGVMFPVLVGMMVRPVRLVVEPTGFGLRSPLGGRLTSWADVDNFRAEVLPFGGLVGRPMVMYDQCGKRTPGVLPAEFEINAFTLAEQLAKYRSDALASR